MKLVAFLLLLSPCILLAQDYAPAAGQPGSTAIHAESELFVAWATGIEVTRGYVDISRPDFEQNGSNYASHGVPEDALGPASNSVVSLGDGGEAIVTFERPIKNGLGFDFAVFENGFDDTFLEFAFVEVSSNGVDYFRFQSHSQTQTEVQVAAFDPVDPTYINNLAGKYRVLYGTPFDISELDDHHLLDKNNITHVKIIDVVGSIDPAYARYDGFGNIINEPFNTPFASSGFDLDAVGVINQQVLEIDDNIDFPIAIYPNPASSDLYIDAKQPVQVTIYDVNGRMIFSGVNNAKGSIDISKLQNGVYILNIYYAGGSRKYRFIKK